MPSSNYTIVTLATERADDPLAGDQSYFRAHPTEASYVRVLSHAERTSAGQLPPGCRQVRVHRVGKATALPAIHLRGFLAPTGPNGSAIGRATNTSTTRRFGVTRVPTADPATVRALRAFLLALP
ncbi:MAG TPA: hypothetical protein VF916_07635 [Ktedonobacterales bacterium]